MKLVRRSSLRRVSIAAVVLLLAAALPALPAQAEPAPPPGPTFAVPGPRIDPERSDTAKAYRKLVAKKMPPAKQHTATRKKTQKPTSKRLAAQAAAPADHSSFTPQTMRDNIAGDFRGVGYQQRMRVENNQLTIRDPQQQGGKVTSVTTDLAPAPDIVYFNVPTLGGNNSFPLSTYSQWSNDKARTGNGGFEFLYDVFHINTVYLAQLDGYVYILGTQGTNGYNPAVDSSPPANPYKVRIYKIAMSQAVNGCATASCAVATYDFPTAWNLDGSVGNILPYYPRAIGPSSLAAGHVNGVGYLAVGLTYGGVQILNTNLQLTDGYGGMATGDSSQTVPTALAWDPAGSGLLSVGVTSFWYTGFFATVNSQGKVTAEPGSIWPSAPGYGLIPTPMTTAVWQPGDGTTMVAFGQSDWSVQLVEPTSAQYSNTVTNISVSGSGIPTAINPVPRVNSSVAGGPDLALSGKAGADITDVAGTVVRYDPGTASMSHVPITPGGGTSITGATAFDSWFPGLKQGRLQITNSSQEEITVSLASSPDAGQGCWWAQDWADGRAFPDSLTVAPGAVSPYHVFGFQSSNSDGSCLTTDSTGTKRAYLVISPTQRPADRQIVQLQIDSSLKVTLQDQAGSGSTTSSLSAKLQQLAAIGLYDVTVTTSNLPTPASNAVPQVKMSQITPFPSDNATSTSPVYKFALQPFTWNVPGLNASIVAPPSTSRLQAVIPPFAVQGSNDGTTWTTIGSFLPIGAVNYNPTAGTVTTSKGTFYWENTPGASYSSIRVSAGSGSATVSSTPLALTPATLTPTYSATGVMTLDAAQPGAVFAANGVDSFPLNVTVNLTNGTSGTDPTQNVYYRNSSTQALVTNLYTLDDSGNQLPFFGVQPDAGAYPNNASTSVRGAANQATDYAVTNSPDSTSVTPRVWRGASGGFATASALQINPSLMYVQAAQNTTPTLSLQTC